MHKRCRVHVLQRYIYDYQTSGMCTGSLDMISISAIAMPSRIQGVQASYDAGLTGM